MHIGKQRTILGGKRQPNASIWVRHLLGRGGFAGARIGGKRGRSSKMGVGEGGFFNAGLPHLHKGGDARAQFRKDSYVKDL